MASTVTATRFRPAVFARKHRTSSGVSGRRKYRELSAKASSCHAKNVKKKRKERGGEGKGESFCSSDEHFNSRRDSTPARNREPMKSALPALCGEMAFAVKISIAQIAP